MKKKKFNLDKFIERVAGEISNVQTVDDWTRVSVRSFSAMVASMKEASPSLRKETLWVSDSHDDEGCLLQLIVLDGDKTTVIRHVTGRPMKSGGCSYGKAARKLLAKFAELK